MATATSRVLVLGDSLGPDVNGRVSPISFPRHHSFRVPFQCVGYYAFFIVQIGKKTESSFECVFCFRHCPNWKCSHGKFGVPPRGKPTATAMRYPALATPNVAGSVTSFCQGSVTPEHPMETRRLNTLCISAGMPTTPRPAASPDMAKP